MIASLLNRLADKRTWRQIQKFVIVSATSATITLGIPIFLHEILGVQEKIAVLVAFVVAYLINFLSLRRLVFDSAASVRDDFVKFALSSLAFRTSEYVLFLVLHEFFGISYILALLAILTTATILKFFWYRRLFDNAGAGVSQ
ncbi:GtrA family protein [Parasphingorhabdus cellanae]|uniref:GtrA family protein n=1 Tax=Parasphingorhabdus cellanae TaxID=2806553 RepID=A0ABX7T5T4_9SPHN|nr:GtrA family protein [Parasphingorhabdus cellanae]QTD55877.1 GtrA family protein [Parasphingorhabdus cellanae]